MTAPQKHGRWLGLDVGGTKLLGLVAGDDLTVLDRLKRPSLRDDGPDAVIERILTLAQELIARQGPVDGLGVGFAGLTDHRTGTILSSIMLPGWDDVPLGPRLSEGLGGIPFFVDNDATAAGWGEYLALGSPPGLNMVLLTVGTGIGGAILIDGRLYRGSTGVSAEFGNTTVDLMGKTCWCGNRGCLNTLASGSAIAERAAELAGQEAPIPVEQVREAAEREEAWAAQALEEGALALGAGVANLINIFNPDRVALTGGVSVLGEAWIERVRVEAKRRAFDESADHAVIAVSAAGNEAGALGAAGLVRDAVMDRESKNKDGER